MTPGRKEGTEESRVILEDDDLNIGVRTFYARDKERPGAFNLHDPVHLPVWEVRGTRSVVRGVKRQKRSGPARTSTKDADIMGTPGN